MRVLPAPGPARVAAIVVIVVITLVVLVALFEAVNRLLPASY